MCTLVIARDLHPRFPLIIGANRDEFYHRPTAGPRLLSTAPNIVGGKDLQGGGTWLGLTPQGLLVAVTNQPDPSSPTRQGLSRGALVLEALRIGEVEAIDRWLADLDGGAYNRFNLIYGDAHRLRVAYGRARPDIKVEDVPTGLHVLPNAALDAPTFPKVQRARTLWPALGEQPSEIVSALRHVLSDHQAPEPLPAEPDSPFDTATRRALHSLCVHTPLYGTRSSAFVGLEPGLVGFYWHSEGPPCEAAPADWTHLLSRE